MRGTPSRSSTATAPRSRRSRPRQLKYASQPALHQELVELTQVPFVHPLRCESLGYGVYTASVVDDDVSAIMLGVGERITDAWAQTLPLRLEKRRRGSCAQYGYRRRLTEVKLTRSPALSRYAR